MRVARALALLLLGLPALSAPLRASPSEAAEVVVGGYVNDIQNLDLTSHSYGVDLYLWFRWKERRLNPSTTFEFINPYELWGHVLKPEFDSPVSLPSGELYQVMRNQGRFSTKLLLYDYPFDRQTLVVELESQSRSLDRLRYVADERPIAINPDLVLPGFVIGQPRLKVVDRTYPTSFGDPRDATHSRFSRVRIEIPIHRSVFTYTIKLLVPVLCVIFCAALMFLFNPAYVDSRVGIGITALLTIVALQITLNEDLPEIDYLVLIDKIYLISYLFVILGLGVVVRSTWMLEKGNLKEAIAFDRFALIALVSAFLVSAASIVVGGLL